MKLRDIFIFPKFETILDFKSFEVSETESFYLLTFKTKMSGVILYLEKYIYINQFVYSEFDLPDRFKRLEEKSSQIKKSMSLDSSNDYYYDIYFACRDYKLNRKELESRGFVVQFIEKEMDSMFGTEKWAWQVCNYKLQNEFYLPHVVYNTNEFKDEYGLLI